MTTGNVYFARPQGSPGPVKIGFSRNPQERFLALTASSPLPLEFAALAIGTLQSERALHQRFADYRIHGEWFQHSNEMEELISFVQENGRLPDLVFQVSMDDVYVAEVVVTRKPRTEPRKSPKAATKNKSLVANNLTWAIVDAAANDLGAPFYTRRAWHRPERKVPFEWRIKITELLRSRGMMVAFADFEQLP